MHTPLPPIFFQLEWLTPLSLRHSRCQHVTLIYLQKHTSYRRDASRGLFVQLPPHILTIHSVDTNISQFYAPWELTKPQHRTVERQVRDAKEQIRREVEEFNAKKNREINELSEALDWGQAVAFKAKNQPPREEPKVALDEDDEAGGSKAAEGLERREDCVKLRWPSSGTGAHFNTMRPQSSNDDEVMVEREDTVIY